MGLPKSQLRFEELPILEWLLRRIQWPGSTLLVTSPAVAHPPAADLFDREAIDPADGSGSLRGVLTALEQSSSLIVAVVTIEMPVIRAPILARSVRVLAAGPDTRGAMFRVASSKGGYIEPFPSAFNREAREQIAASFRANERSVHALAALPGFLTLDAPSEWSAGVWTNLNTPAEFTAFGAMHENLSLKENA